MDGFFVGYVGLAMFCIGFVVGVKYALWTIKKSLKQANNIINKKIEEIRYKKNDKI